MSRYGLFLSMAIPLLAGCAESQTEPEPEPGIRIDGITFSAEAGVRDDGGVTLLVRAVNEADEPRTTQILGGPCMVRRVVWFGGEVDPVVDDRASTEPCQGIALPIDLGAGESLTLPEGMKVFDLRQELGDAFRPGAYRVAGLVRAGAEDFVIPAGTVQLP